MVSGLEDWTKRVRVLVIENNLKISKVSSDGDWNDFLLSNLENGWDNDSSTNISMKENGANQAIPFDTSLSKEVIFDMGSIKNLEAVSFFGTLNCGNGTGGYTGCTAGTWTFTAKVYSSSDGASYTFEEDIYTEEVPNNHIDTEAYSSGWQGTVHNLTARYVKLVFEFVSTGGDCSWNFHNATTPFDMTAKELLLLEK